MTAGTIAAGANLCSTQLFFNSRDQDGGLDCNCSTCSDHTYGPSWSTQTGASCPHNNPGMFGGLGPNAGSPQVEGDITTQGNPLGFGGALGLNTGAAGLAENYIQV